MNNTVELPCVIGEKLWCINDNEELEEVECLGFIITDNLKLVMYKEEFAEGVYNSALNNLVLFRKKEDALCKLNYYKKGVN